MKHFIISSTNRNGIRIALLKLDNADYTPYVVAWAYDTDSGSWGQGHYFCTIKEATDYYYENYVEVNED